MEEYFEEVKSRLKRFKLKGKKAQGYGAERYNSWKSKKTDHTRDYGKRSQKINERIAKRLRRDEKNEGLNNNIVDDEYEEKYNSFRIPICGSVDWVLPAICLPVCLLHRQSHE